MRKNKGITLIALVVTIVVLLILAAVSISMLTGGNGIITQAKDSKDKTEQAKCEELVTVAINGLIAENSGDRSKITPEKIAEQVNKENNRTDVTAEGSTFPTNIIFNEEGRKVGVDIELRVTGEIKEEIYSADVSEEDIAPANIFLYEIIEGTGENSLQVKEAKITGMNPKYCNNQRYEIETRDIYENTNYEIVLEDGTKLTDTLIIPYQVSGKYINGADENEIYKIVEVNLYAGGGTGYSLPKIKTIIYPNTVKIISDKTIGRLSTTDNSSSTLENVTFSKNLEYIGKMAFKNCSNLTSIDIPNSVISIESSAFSQCNKLTKLKIPSSVTSIGEQAFFECTGLINIVVDANNTTYDSRENCNAIIKTSNNELLKGCKNTIIPNDITSIGAYAFHDCGDLLNIEIPNSVTNIGEYAFYACSDLESIKIPSSVTNIKEYTFLSCHNLTSIEIPSSVTSIGYKAFNNCTKLTTVNYTGTKVEWNALLNSISGNNDYLINAKIICTDGEIN